MITKYNNFNEGINQYLKGPSKEELYTHYKNELINGNIDIFKYYELSKQYNFQEPTNEELLNNFNNLRFEYDYHHHITNDYMNIIKLLLDKKVITVEDVYEKAKMSNDEKLIFSIDIDDYNGVVDAVKKGAKINNIVSNPIARACFYGRTEIFRYLTKKCTDMLGYKDWGITDYYLLGTSMQQGHYDIFEILLKYNPDIEPSRLELIERDPKFSAIYNKEYKKPINKFIRFFNGTNEGINQYLKGPNKEDLINDAINSYGDNQYNILLSLIKNNEIEILTEIFDKGITINKEIGSKLILASINYRKFNIFHFLLRNKLVPDRDSLSFAKAMGFNVIYRTIKDAIDSYELDNNNVQEHKYNEGINQYLKGPNKEEIWKIVRDLPPIDLLLKSCKIGFFDGIKKAIDLGANIHINEEYPLVFAAENGNLETVKYLHSLGADIHINSDRAFRWASEMGHLDVVKYLLENDADIHANDDEAFMLAISNLHLDVVDFLLKKGIDTRKFLNDAIRNENDDIKLIEIFIENGADFSNPRFLGLAAYDRNHNIVKFLLNKFNYTNDDINNAIGKETKNNKDVIDLLNKYLKEND